MARVSRNGVNYLGWTLIALVGYTIFTPLASLATDDVPSTAVALVANTILALSALSVVLYRNEPLGSQFAGANWLYIVGAGVFLTIGILAYYRALAGGPVSVVTPIYGMFLVGSSMLSVLFLDESLTLRKGAGIVLAVVAVYLTATG
jgi:transporter family protein